MNASYQALARQSPNKAFYWYVGRYYIQVCLQSSFPVPVSPAPLLGCLVGSDSIRCRSAGAVNSLRGYFCGPGDQNSLVDEGAAVAVAAALVGPPPTFQCETDGAGGTASLSADSRPVSG